MAADPLGSARLRAAALREDHRRRGHWSGRPADVVREAASRFAQLPAIVGRAGTTTFAELDDRVDAAAVALTRNGVEPGAPVAVVAANDPASVVACHAVLRLDAVLVLIAPTAGRAHLEQAGAQIAARVGVAPAGWLEQNGQTGAVRTWLSAQDLQAGRARGPVPVPGRPADEPSVVLFTSGTTARPKGVIHSISTLAKASRNYIAAAGLDSGDTVFLVSPLSSVTGVLQGLFVGPMLGCPVVLEDRFDPRRTFELLVASGGTWYGGPDLLLDRLLDQAPSAQDMPLRAVYLGGTMLDRAVVARVEDDFGIVVMRAYGSSEVPVSTSGLREDPRDVRHGDDGVPLADVEVRLGSELDPRECCMRGPHAFLGYTAPDDDAHAWPDGWFHTGDAAELSGGRLRITGRLRDIVVRNGLKVPIAEVEEAVTTLPSVLRSAGFSAPDEETGERLVMAVRPAPGERVEFDGLVAALVEGGLAKFKLPEEIVFWDAEFPLNPTGKVDRRRLARESTGRPRQSAARLLG